MRGRGAASVPPPGRAGTRRKEDLKTTDMEQERHPFQNIVAETLLIPLYMRAKESRRGPEAILHDPMAEQLVEKIDYDYGRLDTAPLSEVGCVVRGWYFDRAVKRFVEACPGEAVVVNVGCGLDTRWQRLADSRAAFYELDLPEVIDLRRRLIPEPAADRYLAASLLDTDWMDTLRSNHPEARFIFVAEGVLMYFYESQVRSFVRAVARRFGGGELWFDVCGSMMSRRGLKPDSLRGHQAQIRSGIDDGRTVEGWDSRLRLLRQDNYMRFFRPRWGFLYGQVLGRMTRLCYRFSSLLGYEIRQV